MNLALYPFKIEKGLGRVNGKISGEDRTLEKEKGLRGFLASAMRDFLPSRDSCGKKIIQAVAADLFLETGTEYLPDRCPSQRPSLPAKRPGGKPWDGRGLWEKLEPVQFEAGIHALWAWSESIGYTETALLEVTIVNAVWSESRHGGIRNCGP